MDICTYIYMRIHISRGQKKAGLLATFKASTSFVSAFAAWPIGRRPLSERTKRRYWRLICSLTPWITIMMRCNYVVFAHYQRLPTAASKHLLPYPYWSTMLFFSDQFNLQWYETWNVQVTEQWLSCHKIDVQLKGSLIYCLRSTMPY